jgi:hypothetical protein
MFAQPAGAGMNAGSDGFTFVVYFGKEVRYGVGYYPAWKSNRLL